MVLLGWRYCDLSSAVDHRRRNKTTSMPVVSMFLIEMEYIEHNKLELQAGIN